jgi:hypothetical protein
MPLSALDWIASGVGDESPVCRLDVVELQVQLLADEQIKNVAIEMAGVHFLPKDPQHHVPRDRLRPVGAIGGAERLEDIYQRQDSGL